MAFRESFVTNQYERCLQPERMQEKERNRVKETFQVAVVIDMQTEKL